MSRVAALLAVWALPTTTAPSAETFLGPAMRAAEGAEVAHAGARPAEGMGGGIVGRVGVAHHHRPVG